MSGYIQSNQMVYITAPGAVGTYSVQAADSGKTILVPALGGAGANTLTILLPARQAGLKYRFMADDTLVSTATITPTTNGITALNASVYGSLLNLTPGAAGACVIAAVAKVGNNTCQLL